MPKHGVQHFHNFTSPQQNYTSGVSMVDAAARAALIKPIGSENQLQKLSHAKNNKTIGSPINRKGTVKTDTNWANNTGSKFHDKNVNASYNNFVQNKSGVHWERNENVNTSNIAIFEQQGPPERTSHLL